MRPATTRTQPCGSSTQRRTPLCACAPLRNMGQLGNSSEWKYSAGMHTGMHSEQKALVDFLVLARGRAFVGMAHSTFSYYLEQLRRLQVRALTV